MILLLAGASIIVEAPDVLQQQLRYEFGPALEAAYASSPTVRLTWTDAGWLGDGVGLFPCSETTSALIAPMVLARMLCVLNPALRILHGNAVQAGGRLVLLLGESGGGKSTLSRALMKVDPDARLVAEDWLMLDANLEVLHRFPRAATIRDADRSERRAIPERIVSEATLPLPGAAAFLLWRSTEAPETPAEFILSRDDGELAGQLRARWNCAVECEAVRGLGHLTVARPLSSTERMELALLARARGVLVLAPAEGGRTTPWLRPATPMISECAASAGIAEVLRHYVVSENLPPAGLEFLLIAKALDAVRVFRLTPGGSPQETAGAITGAIA